MDPADGYRIWRLLVFEWIRIWIYIELQYRDQYGSKTPVLVNQRCCLSLWDDYVLHSPDLHLGILAPAPPQAWQCAAEPSSWRRSRYSTAHVQPCTAHAYNQKSTFVYPDPQLAVLDPDSYWECGSGSRSMEIDKTVQLTWFPACQKGFRTS